MGKPVIAFAVGGIPEIVRDGETGFLVHEISERALASAIAAANDRARLRTMGDKARAFALKNRVETMCAAYGDAYEKLMGTTTRSSESTPPPR